MKYLFFPATFIAATFTSLATYAQEHAKNWQLGMPEPVTPVAEQLHNMHNFLLVLITIISVFVLLVLIYICLRFNRRANPVASKTTHNVKLEVIWTVIPIIILVIIAIPSLRLHYFMEDTVEPEITIKAVGYQWYWHYDYPDHGGFGFDSYMKKGDDLKPEDIRMLSVDNHIVVPVDTKVRVLLTGADVIHAWAVPAFGVKRDAVPGRLNETWFKATKTGTYYGQCSELCGVGHGFMPIAVDVVSKEQFAQWVGEKQKEAGIMPEKKDAADEKPAEGKAETPAAHSKEEKPAAEAAEKE